ncbi:MAG TPA: IPT/TIG domain-containing protein [Candidatus Acidoferrum sp.]|nr:IPT/TIG domain-containing protein [Candidatus Acidoferrum sp.]
MKTSQKLLPVKIILLGALIAGTLACGYSAKTMPAAAGTMPTVAQLAPASTTAGGAAFTLTVNGTNFSSNAVVNLNGTAQTSNTTFVSGNQLMVAVPAAAIATSGTVSVTVTNPGSPGTGMYGSGGTLAETSSPMDFTIH